MAGGLEDLLAGRTLVKRYRIQEVIGRGGFAVVYCADDLRLGRPTAVKVLAIPAPTPEVREQLRARFEHEARAAASLPHHPNVLPVYDFGTDPETGIDFIVMELLRGENVAAYLAREKRPPLPLALRILRDATEGVAVGHRAGLIHRDVKPGNIFLAEAQGDQPFRVCVLDFGIARLVDEDEASSMTRTRGAAPLSPAYASPEQLRGDRDLTAAADVFSLGVVGYQLLTGQKPIDSERTAATGAELKPIRSVNPQVPAALEAVIERAMNPDPAQRFPTADAFAEALDAAAEPDDSETLIATSAPPIMDEERTVIAPAAAIPAAAIPAAASVPPPAPAPLPRRDPTPVPPPRARKRGWMVALPLLALGGVAGVYALSGDGGGGSEALAPADSAETRPAAPSDEEVPVTMPADTESDPGAAQGGTTDEPGGETPVQVAPVPINPNAGGGDPPPFSAPPAQQQPAPAQQQPAQPQPRQPAPAQQRPVPRPPRPVPQPRERPPVPQPQQPQPQPQPQQPQPQPQPQPPAPQPQPQPPAPQPPAPQPQPPQPTPYPAPRDTIVIPPRPVPLPIPMTSEAPR